MRGLLWLLALFALAVGISLAARFNDGYLLLVVPPYRIEVALSLAIFLFFRRNWWPHGAVLGEVEGLDGWHSTKVYPEARQVPGVVVYRWEAPLFFANAGQFRQQIRRLVRERQPDWVVLQCEAVTDVDVTAAEMLEKLDLELNDQGVHMAFAEMRERLQDLTLEYGLFETLDRDHFYPTIETAIEATRKKQGTGPEATAP